MRPSASVDLRIEGAPGEGLDDRGAQRSTSSGRRRAGDPRRRHRPRRTGRARHPLRRQPRARTRRDRRLPPPRVVAVAAVSKQIRVLIVDDDALVRAGLSMLLAGAEGIEVVGEAADGSDVAEAVAEHGPDIVLMDIRMPGMDGLAATELVRAQSDGARGDRPHDIRGRRLRRARAARRRQRVPAQRHPAGRHRPRRAGRRRRRPDALAHHHPPADQPRAGQ